jgi:transposase InsO family protein
MAARGISWRPVHDPFRCHVGFGPAGEAAGCSPACGALSPEVTVFAPSPWFPAGDNRPFLLQFQFFGHTGRVFHVLTWAISAAFRSRAQLIAENLCLRQQLSVLQRRSPQPPLRNADRRFWICASRWFASWRSSLLIVKPETVLRWHRQGWRAYWSWRSQRGRRNIGRRPIPQSLQALIRWMTIENRLWGQFLIHDRDGRYGVRFDCRMHHLGIKQMRTPFRTPRANSIAERWVKSARTECLDHLFVFNEAMRRVMSAYVGYFNHWRPHRSLGQRAPCDSPALRPRSPEACGRIVAQPILGVLHHIYKLAA